MGRGTPLAVLLLLAVALPAAAQTNQHWGSFGLSLVSVEGTSSEVSDTGTSLVLDDGLGATFDWTWSFSRRFSLAVGLTLARHDIETDDGLFADLEGGTIWAAPVTLGVEYTIPLYGRYEPYVGAGVCGLAMFLGDPGSEIEAAGLDEYRPGAGIGPFLQAGLRYHTDSNWNMALDVRFTDVEVDLELRNHGGDEIDTVTVDMSPTIVTLAVGYRF